MRESAVRQPHSILREYCTVREHITVPYSIKRPPHAQQWHHFAVPLACNNKYYRSHGNACRLPPAGLRDLLKHHQQRVVRVQRQRYGVAADPNVLLVPDVAVGGARRLSGQVLVHVEGLRQTRTIGFRPSSQPPPGAASKLLVRLLKAAARRLHKRATSWPR